MDLNPAPVEVIEATRLVEQYKSLITHETLELSPSDTNTNTKMSE